MKFCVYKGCLRGIWLAVLVVMIGELGVLPLAGRQQGGGVPAEGYSAVSPAEVTAFMQTFQKNPAEAAPRLRSNPKRVSLLLGAIGKDPAGPWATYLQAFCFEVERSSALKESPANYAQANAKAMQYLSSARATLAKALQTSPGKLEIQRNLALMESALARALADSRPQTNRPPSAVPGPTLNPRLRTNAQPTLRATGDPASQIQACSGQITQIGLAKKMWREDNGKPNSATPSPADLVRYFPDHRFPTCPGGGNYVIGSLGQQPRCTVH